MCGNSGELEAHNIGAGIYCMLFSFWGLEKQLKHVLMEKCIARGEGQGNTTRSCDTIGIHLRSPLQVPLREPPFARPPKNNSGIWKTTFCRINFTFWSGVGRGGWGLGAVRKTAPRPGAFVLSVRLRERGPLHSATPHPQRHTSPATAPFVFALGLLLLRTMVKVIPTCSGQTMQDTFTDICFVFFPFFPLCSI